MMSTSVIDSNKFLKSIHIDHFYKELEILKIADKRLTEFKKAYEDGISWGEAKEKLFNIINSVRIKTNNCVSTSYCPFFNRFKYKAIFFN